ncbi:MAG: NAD(P)-dependent oxidoreductase [Rhodoglobus sp.]|nr:NAD(P)-dependent oxidoreductase [Rhodoglobus sp.]
MSIVVTGATGHLGRLIVEALLRDGTPPGDIVAAGRSTGKRDDLVARGVRVARIDFSEPDTLDAAFAGAGTVMLVSASEPGQRFAQHKAAIDAAKAAGVNRIVYTSAPAATTSALVLAPEHKATEEYLVESGVPFTILRNGWYTENYTGAARQAIASGTLASSTGAGTVSSASRKDYADAAAAVLLDDSYAGKTYELSGDTAWDFAELAAAITEISGTPVALAALTPEEHRAALLGAGLDEGTAGFVVALDGNIRDGLLGHTPGDLSRLIGRPTTPLRDGLAAELVE